jgi:hypothetical protein
MQRHAKTNVVGIAKPRKQPRKNFKNLPPNTLDHLIFPRMSLKDLEHMGRGSRALRTVASVELRRRLGMYQPVFREIEAAVYDAFAFFAGVRPLTRWDPHRAWNKETASAFFGAEDMKQREVASSPVPLKVVVLDSYLKELDVVVNAGQDLVAFSIDTERFSAKSIASNPSLRFKNAALRHDLYDIVVLAVRAGVRRANADFGLRWSLQGLSNA